MIKLIRHGDYRLVETNHSTRVLSLDQRGTYAWIHNEGISEIFIASHKERQKDCVLSQGKYRLYKVTDEPGFTDTYHLELFVGNGIWQGYLLPTGLPNNRKKKNKVNPTGEIITKTRISWVI